MATTQKGIYYPDDYTAIADIPEDMKDLAESVDTALGDLEDNIEQNIQPQIDDIEEEQTTQNNNIEALQIENARLKATLPTTTGEGTEVTLQNTAELEFIKPPLPRGNSEQVQYSGKNLAKVSGSSISIGGTLVVQKSANDIILSGTMTGDNSSQKSFTIDGDIKENYPNYIVPNNTISLTAGTYVLTIDNITGSYSGINNFKIRLVKKGTSIPYTIVKELTLPTTSITINISTDGEYFVVPNFLYSTGATITFNNYKFNIMLASGTDDTYEPYVGGTASPNPSFPSPIQNVTGDVEVVVQNKNLEWNGWASDFVSRINDSTKAKLETKDGRSCLFYLASAGYNEYDSKYLFKPKGGYKENTQYTFSFDLYSTTITGNLTIEYTDGSRTGINTTANTWTNISVTSASGKTIKYLRPSWFSGSDYIDLNTFMVVEGTASTYTPHKEQTLPLTLGSIELCKIGDCQDYFYKENNKWYLYKVIIKTIFDGSENWVNYIASDGIFTIASVSDYMPNEGSLGYFAKYLKWTGSATQIPNNSFKFITNQKQLIIRDTRFTELSNFKAELATNNLTAYYPLATPTSTEITDTTLIEQLDAISNALSYEEQTNISGTSDESNPLFSVEAYQSIKLILAS